MCTDNTPAGLAAALPWVLHDFEPAVQISLEPVDSVEITVLMDNVTDAMMASAGPARRPGLPQGRRPSAVMTGGQALDALTAEHGFSALVTVSRAGREHRILFDTGGSPDGVTGNMARLGIDPRSIEAIVCSHGHFDHTTGLDGLIRALGGTAGLPVLIHPHFWRQRRLLVPGRDPVEIPAPSQAALTGAGFTIIEEQQPSFLLDGSVLVTGEVPRVTGYEPGFPPQQALLGGTWQPDPLVLDEQAIIMNVAGRGLVVLTGCGHAGVVNIARYARVLTGGQPLHALVGGFHLNGPLFEPLIPRVLDDLAALSPGLLVPAHCTGWTAQLALAGRFGEACLPSTVGTTFRL